MAQTALDLTLETIRDLLVDEVKFLCAVSGELEGAQKELKRLQSILKKTDGGRNNDPSAQNFLQEIRDICCRIEDAVDEYASEVLLTRPKWGILGRIACAPCECYSIHQTGAEIASIKADISGLIDRMQGDSVINKAVGSDGQEWEEVDRRKKEEWSMRNYGVEEIQDFVGMEQDLDLLTSKMCTDDARIVSIVGMGGLGKTTLAEKVYLNIRSNFEAYAWVRVSKTFDPRIIMQDLLEQLNNWNRAVTNPMGDHVLGKELHKVLKAKKCLIVLDDVWKVNDWTSINRPFPVADTKSKVLITTRNLDVAKAGFVHPLGVLSPDEAWQLLQKKAFLGASGLQLEQTLEETGRTMVQKCGYLPLTITVLGGILSKGDTSDWNDINDKIDLYLKKADGNKYKEIEQVLSLSFDDLPYDLKPCFLYLSRFPEDEAIRVEELYLLWMAEGIVSPENQWEDETLRDVARRYLEGLVSRSMVQVEGDEFQLCRLHDLLRDLCIRKASEEDYFKLADFRGGNTSSSLNSITLSRMRRLAVYMDGPLDSVSLTEESTQRLRSFLLHLPKPVYLFQDLVMTLPQGFRELEKFRFLRVLGFQYVKFEDQESLAGIGKLIHLRLLAFWYCHLLQLPSSIGDLQSLQTLDLETRSFLLIPDHLLQKLKKLKYLNVINAGGAEGKLSLIGLDELETLHGFKSNDCQVADLSTLSRLKRLDAEIHGNADLSQFIDCIESNGRRLEMSAVVICDCDFISAAGGGESLLRKLFSCRNIHRLSVQGIVEIGKLPKYDPGFFPNLTELNLQGGDIQEDPMGTLEKLPKLRKLVLVEKSFVGGKMSCHAEGFAQLRHLELNRLRNLRMWMVEEGAMKRLSVLNLSSCHGLDMIPEGVAFLTNLRSLEIADMSENFQQRIGGGGEDFDKVRHVNSIFIHF